MWMVITAVLGMSVLMYTWDKCGAKALVLGNGAGAAAVLGMCD